MTDFFSERPSIPFINGQPGVPDGQFFPQDAITAQDPYDVQRPEITTGDEVPLITATEEDEESAGQFPASDPTPFVVAAAMDAGRSDPGPEREPDLPPAQQAVSAPLGELAVDPSGSALPEGPEPAPVADQPETVSEPQDLPPAAPDAVAAVANEAIVTDPELASLLTQGIEALGEERLDHLLRANDRFNRAVTTMHEDGSETVDEQYYSRRFLRQIPDYAAAATEAGLEPEQAQGLLVHALDSAHHPNFDYSDRTAAHLTRAMGTAANAGEPLTEANVQQLKDLISVAAENDVVRPGLQAYVAARQAGLSSEDSVGLVNDYLASQNYRQIGYNISRFTRALSTLNIAGVDPELTKETFAAFRTVRPEPRSAVYDEFKNLITMGAPAMGKTAAELMQATVDRLRGGAADMHDAIGQVIRGEGEPASIDSDAPVVIDPAERRDKHFIPVSGPLGHAALPYRTERSLNDGVRDIEKLTAAVSYHGDVVGEGAWVYSPEKGTWYSLGGETEFLAGGDARHTYIHFDPSELSGTPLFFHVHPEDVAIHGDRIGHVFPSDADYRTVATVQENAGGPVTPRSFISHGLGITEFTFPADSQAIRAVSEIAQDMQHSLFARFGDERTMMQQARAAGEYEFAQWCVGQINAALPDGFNITLYPRGVNLEQAAGVGRPPKET
ncbi:MAG TPA: hypothetical protein VGO07_02570 [Candidatus Saccharimonadales bacterium]|jgi:hypothetical protein|nr:hypothetical protein [Candidatus Saccharimonadales bacterium]